MLNIREDKRRTCRWGWREIRNFLGAAFALKLPIQHGAMTYSLRNCILEHSCVLEQLWGSIPVCEVVPRLKPAVQPTQYKDSLPYYWVCASTHRNTDGL